MKQIFCFIGPPGSGKGTHSMRFVATHGKLYSLLRFSVGDELRARQNLCINGELSDTKDVENIIDSFLSLEHDNTIIDGYPRSLEQLKHLFARTLNGQISNIVLFDLQINNRDVLISRLMNRYTCSLCGFTSQIRTNACPDCLSSVSQRIDDSDIDAINNRMEVYYSSYNEIKDFCLKNSIDFVKFDATLKIDEIFQLVESNFLKYLSQDH